LLATRAAASARRIARSLIGPTNQVPQPPVAVFASGRGSLHKDLMHFLEEALHPLPVQTTAPLAMPPEAKEAFTYALLAHQILMGRPGNFPPATGARRMVPLGRISV
jgi:anhydro-N-acetylmuramic acid kinase